MSTRLHQRDIAKTASFTISPANGHAPGTNFTNRGASGSVTATLLAASAALMGHWYTFRVHADQSLIVAAASVNTLVTLGDSAADNVGFQVANKKVGRAMFVYCDGTSWFAQPFGSYDGFCIDGTEITITPVLGAVAATSVTTSGLIKSSGTAGVGYATGAGGAVTQITSRATGVALSKICGQITTDTSSLAAAAEAEFVVTNTLVAATDVVVVNITPGGTGTPHAYCSGVAAGSFKITITNLHASTADTSADVINFAVIKGVAA